MAHTSGGPELGAASNPEILSLKVVPFKGGRSDLWPGLFRAIVSFRSRMTGLSGIMNTQIPGQEQRVRRTR